MVSPFLMNAPAHGADAGAPMAGHDSTVAPRPFKNDIVQQASSLRRDRLTDSVVSRDKTERRQN
jgi:hypothetical protein